MAEMDILVFHFQRNPHGGHWGLMHVPVLQRLVPGVYICRPAIQGDHDCKVIRRG